MFTIEVKKKEKGEKFTFNDLEMLHQECYGGKVVFEWESWVGYHFECLRCGKSVKIENKSEGKVKFKIVQTAIDGKERQLTKNIHVIQKT